MAALLEPAYYLAVVSLMIQIACLGDSAAIRLSFEAWLVSFLLLSVLALTSFGWLVVRLVQRRAGWRPVLCFCLAILGPLSLFLCEGLHTASVRFFQRDLDALADGVERGRGLPTNAQAGVISVQEAKIEEDGSVYLATSDNYDGDHGLLRAARPRPHEHNVGKTVYTRLFGRWYLVWSE